MVSSRFAPQAGQVMVDSNVISFTLQRKVRRHFSLL
jgi:hypothetical protein